MNDLGAATLAITTLWAPADCLLVDPRSSITLCQPWVNTYRLLSLLQFWSTTPPFIAHFTSLRTRCVPCGSWVRLPSDPSCKCSSLLCPVWRPTPAGCVSQAPDSPQEAQWEVWRANRREKWQCFPPGPYAPRASPAAPTALPSSCCHWMGLLWS